MRRSRAIVPRCSPSTSRDFSRSSTARRSPAGKATRRTGVPRTACSSAKSPPATVIKSNTFIIWRGGTPADFELKLDYRITEAGNSGINYRSVVVPDHGDAGKQVRDEGLSVRSRRPQAVRRQQLRREGAPVSRRARSDVARRRRPAAGRALVVRDVRRARECCRPSDWNAAHLIVRGNTATHILNGRLMSITIDDDAPNRKLDGLIGMQVHVGPPMKIEYRNIRLKRW